MRSTSRSLARLSLVTVWIPLINLGAQTARAQDYLAATGSPTFSANQPVELGFLDLANGNLHLETPLGNFPQRGSQHYSAALVYDSRIWKQVWNGTAWTWQPTNVPNSQGGWRFVSSIAEGKVTMQGTSTIGPPPRNCITTKYNNFTWTDPFGTPHLFPGQTTQVSAGCGVGTSSAGGLAVDSTGFKISITNYTVPVVWGPDGTRLYDGTQTDPSRKDPNGNFFSKDANGNIVDTLGRTPITYVANGAGCSTSYCYNVLNSQGSTSQIKVTTQTVNVNTLFGQSGGVTEYSGSFIAIQTIALPDGTSYSFSYDSGTSVGHYGVLTAVTLLTGGQVTYGRAIFQDSFNNKNLWYTSRVSGGGTWSYTPAVLTTCAPGTVNCQQKVTVARPSTDNIVFTFTLNNGAWNTLTQTYSGAISPANLVATVTTNYDMTVPCVTVGCIGNQYIRPISRIETVPVPGGSSITKQSQYAYDTPQNGNIAAFKRWKFLPGTSPAFPATPDAETDLTYLSTSPYISQNIINRILSTTIKDNGTVVAQTNFSYDDSGTLLASTPPSGIAHHDDTNYGISTTVRGNLTKTQRCTVLATCTTNYVQTAMTYDTTGQVLSIQDPRQNTTTFGYADNFFTDNGANPPAPFPPSAPTNAYLASITPPLIGTANFGYYYNTGKRASWKDQNNADSFTHFLDLPDRQTHLYGPIAPNASRPWVLSTYPTNSENQGDTYTGITDTTASAACSSCRQNEVVLDGLGRLTARKLMNDPEGSTSVTRTYDSTGRLFTISHPFRSTGDPTYGLESFTYDGLDRVTKITHPDNSYVQTFYGAAVGGTGLGGRSTQLCLPSTYGTGYPVLSIDEISVKRQIWSDGFGKTIEVDEPDSSGALNSGTCYKYDAQGNLVQVTHGSQTRTYLYDSLSRLKSASIPEVSDAQGAQCPTTYNYDNNSNLQTTTTPAPNQGICSTTVTATFSYDALNRLTGKTYSDSTASVLYGYDGVAPTGCATNPPALTTTNPKGRRTSMCDGSGAASWSYDASGNVLAEARNIAGITKTITYSYNLDGSAKDLSFPSTAKATYTVSNAGRVTSMKDLVSGTQFATNAIYSAPGNLLSVIAGKVNGGFGGVTESHTYNNRLELTSGQASSTEKGTALNLSYGYSLPGGNNGTVASITNNVDNGRTQSYAYDNLNRILTAQSQATSGIDCWGQSFGDGATAADDPLANLLAVNITKCSGNMLSVSVNGNNHINSSSAYQYDVAGNMTQDGSGLAYTFDAEGRMTQASGMSGGPYCYVYDGNALRVARKSNAIPDCAHGTIVKLYWRSIAGDTIAETDANGSTTNSVYNEFIFFDGRRIASRNGLGVVYYYFVDQLGSTRAVTDASGNLCYDAEFTPYGDEMAHSERLQTSPCSTNYKFTGYERDGETNLDYAFARYYRSGIGRFLAADPHGGASGNPQSHNSYAYVLNSPTNFVDALGMDCGTRIGHGWGCPNSNGSPSGSGGLRDPTEGFTIFDAIAGVPGTYIYFDDHGSLQWGYSFDAAHNPFKVKFTGTLFGKSYEKTFDTIEDYMDWRSYIASLPENRIYAAFIVIAKNQGFGANELQEVKYRDKALVYSVWLPCDAGQGCTVATDNLDGFWPDPITFLHQGNPSWYQGLFWETPHLIGSDPMSAHVDPFGPFNPLHYVIQMPAMLFPGSPIGNGTCAINGGCTIH